MANWKFKWLKKFFILEKRFWLKDTFKIIEQKITNILRLVP